MNSEFENKEKEELKKLKESHSQQLSQLGFVLSHDLSSPANNLELLIDILQDDHGQNLPSEGQEQLKIMQECVGLIKKIIENTVAYINVAATPSEEKEVIYLADLFDSIYQRIGVPASAIIKWPNNLPTIKSYPIRIRQIFHRLIENAVRFNNQDEPVIEIDFEETNHHFHFQITDNGPGIPNAYHQKVFKLFETLEQPDRDGKKGAGLGLTVVKLMVEELGGEIKLENKNEGGCTFRFSIRK